MRAPISCDHDLKHKAAVAKRSSRRADLSGLNATESGGSCSADAQLLRPRPARLRSPANFDGSCLTFGRGQR